MRVFHKLVAGCLAESNLWHLMNSQLNPHFFFLPHHPVSVLHTDFQQFMAPFEKEIEQQMHMREYQAMEKHGKAEQTHQGLGFGMPNEDGQISWIQEVASR